MDCDNNHVVNEVESDENKQSEDDIGETSGTLPAPSMSMSMPSKSPDLGSQTLVTLKAIHGI